MADRKFTVKTVLSDYFQGTVSETKLRAWIKTGAIPHFKIAGKIIFSETTLNGWFREKELESLKKNTD